MLHQMNKPTYGELIDIFENSLDSDDFCSTFHLHYPHIVPGRRFYDTVCRIVAPTKISHWKMCSDRNPVNVLREMNMGASN